MTRHPSPIARRRPRPHRCFLLGFLTGFVVTVPAVWLALLFPVAERLLPVVTPGVALLRPLSSAMAAWPGGVNMLLGSLANGLVVGLLVVAGGLVLGRGRLHTSAESRRPSGAVTRPPAAPRS